MNELQKFEGFPNPESNYFKMPNCIIDHMPSMSKAVLKVILYTIRHTWGFGEYGKFKRITTDEYVNGRKRKDGSRLDNGTGLSSQSVYVGLKTAVEQGFLEVEVDDRDKARIKKSYRLTAESDTQNLGIDSLEIGDRLPRNWGPIRERNLEKETKKKTLSEQKCSDHVRSNEKKKRKKPNTFDKMMANDLAKVVSSHIKINRLSDRGKWPDEIRKMREIDKVSEEDIERAIDWYKEFIGQEYIPEAFTARTFRDKYKNGKIPAAIRRTSKNGSGKMFETDHNKLLDRIDRMLLQQELSMSQKNIDNALIDVGMKPGMISVKELRRHVYG